MIVHLHPGDLNKDHLWRRALAPRSQRIHKDQVPSRMKYKFKKSSNTTKQVIMNKRTTKQLTAELEL